MERVVEPELIEALPTQDPRAARSRRDLHRFHRMAFIHKVWMHWLGKLGPGFKPQRIVELGAGDGLLMLRLARVMSARWPGVNLVLLDQDPAVSPETQNQIQDLGWKVNVVQADAFCWMNKAGSPLDLVVANRFLHHFTTEELEFLLHLVSARTQHFFACEPRRSLIQLMAARLYSWMGCNSVTRHDMVRCVLSGFTGTELSRLWPCRTHWKLGEHASGLCCHGFLASKVATPQDTCSTAQSKVSPPSTVSESAAAPSGEAYHTCSSRSQHSTDQQRCPSRVRRF